MEEFKHLDKIIIIAPASTSPEEVSCIDGELGVYLRKANDNESVVRLVNVGSGLDTVFTVENKYIKLFDDWSNRRKREENMNEKHAKSNGNENFIFKLQELLGIADGVKFRLNTNLLLYRCYFENGKLILTDKNSDKVIEDDNLRNKVFYDLATGVFKPIVENLTTIPRDGYKYYYWDTFFAEDDEEQDQDVPVVNFDFWRGSIKDYMCFYTGNCFPTRESCAKNYNIIERIKDGSLKSATSKNHLIVGPAKVAIPILGTVKHKAVSFNKTVGAYILECGKDEYGHRRYFVVLDKDFSEASPGAPIEERFSSLLELPNTEYKASEEN